MTNNFNFSDSTTNNDNIDYSNIVFSKYKDLNWDYKKWLKDNFESDNWWFEYQELNRISFLLSVLSLYKKEDIDFKNSEDNNLVVNWRQLEKYINSYFLDNDGKNNNFNTFMILKAELEKSENLLDKKIDFYEKSEKIVLGTENKVSVIMWWWWIWWFSHLWVLKILAKNNIPIHTIWWISMWSMIGTYLSMIVWKDWQVKEEDIDFIISVVKDIKLTWDLIETVWDKKYIRTSEIINSYIKDKVWLYSKVPFDIQVRLLEWGKKKNWVILENDKWTNIDLLKSQTQASTANKKIFPELSDVVIDWNKYEDDTSSWLSSNSTLVKYNREKHNPTLVIWLPVSLIDLYPNIKDILFKLPWFKKYKDQWDILIESFKEKWDDINSLFKKEKIIENGKEKIIKRYYAKNKDDLNKWKIKMWTWDFIDLWIEAWEKQISEILKKLWLIRFI